MSHLIVTAFDRWERLADKHLRGLCQCSVECEEVAELSDTVTSLSYARSHWYAVQSRLAWQWHNNGGFYGARKPMRGISL